MATLKGQNLRVFIGTEVVAKATNCVITLTGNTEESSTKDDVGMSAKPDVVSNSWQVQDDSLDVTDIGTLVTAMKAGTKFTIMWDKTSTANNYVRDMDEFNRHGDAFLTDATFNFNDRENSAKSITFTGTGKLEKDDVS